jgi:general secretion pathway protein I
MKRGLGFTLIEVMVALAVFSVVSVALVKNTSTSLRLSGMIEDRTIAWWLAENKMTSLRMLPRTDDSYPNSGTSREVVEMDDTSWDVETTVETTENDYVRRIVISVYRENQEDARARLVGFLGRY